MYVDLSMCGKWALATNTIGVHGGAGESGEEEYYKGRVWSAGGWTSVTSTHGLVATTGVATNTERSLSLPCFPPHKAIHHNTDRQEIAVWLRETTI